MQSSRNIIGSIMQTTLLCSHGTSNGHCYATGCGHAMRLCKHTRQRRDIKHPATSIASTGASNAINRCSIMQTPSSIQAAGHHRRRKDFMQSRLAPRQVEHYTGHEELCHALMLHPERESLYCSTHMGVMPPTSVLAGNKTVCTVGMSGKQSKCLCMSHGENIPHHQV